MNSKIWGRQIKAGLARNGEGLCSKDGEADCDCVAGIEDRGHRPHTLPPDRELMKEESRRLGLSGGAMALANPRTY